MESKNTEAEVTYLMTMVREQIDVLAVLQGRAGTVVRRLQAAGGGDDGELAYFVEKLTAVEELLEGYESPDARGHRFVRQGAPKLRSVAYPVLYVGGDGSGDDDEDEKA